MLNFWKLVGSFVGSSIRKALLLGLLLVAPAAANAQLKDEFNRQNSGVQKCAALYQQAQFDAPGGAHFG